MPMNNTAMNFNSSLFDNKHRIPDEHFEARDDLESRESSKREEPSDRKQSSFAVEDTTRSRRQTMGSKNAKGLGATFDRDDSAFGDRSEDLALGAEECYQSFMRKADANANLYETKGMGFIPGMDGTTVTR